MPEGILLGIVGTAFGFLLNEVSQYLRARREDRRDVRKVIFTLLDFESQLKIDTEFLSAVAKQSEIGPNVSRLTYSIIGDFEGQPEELQSRLASASAQVAQLDPLLARRLRSMMRMRELFPVLQPSSQMSFTGSESAKMTAYAYGQASEAIREVIDKLARRHDLSLYLRMKWRAFSSDGSSSMNWDDLVSAAAQLDSRD